MVYMAPFLPIIVFLGLLCLLTRLPKYPHGLPNGRTWFLPFIGQTLSFLKPHKSYSIGAFLEHHCSRYGRVFRSHLFGSPTIVSCDLELNLFILQNEGRYFESYYPKPVRDILGDLSMMLVKGSLHKKLRGVAIGFINESKSRPQFFHYMDKLCLYFVKSLRAKREVHFFKEAKEFTFFFMLKNLLSMDYEDPLAGKFLQDFLTFMEGFVSIPISIPGTAYYKAIKARKRIWRTLKEIIKNRGGKRKGDFLDELLANVGLKDDEKVSIVLDLLFAGYETTSGLMSIVVYFLAKATTPPSLLNNLKEEHKALRKDNGDPLDWEDYKKMELTSHVLNEALRCGNLVKFVHRKAIKDVKFKEYLIPAGWQVLPISTAAHLDPRLHENPHEFNPWRWQNITTSKKVIPFGGGLRICPGAELGKLETAIFLHHFILNFRWKIKGDDYPISAPYLMFKGGLLLEVENLQE